MDDRHVRPLARLYQQFVVDVITCIDIQRFQVSGRGCAKYCWDVVVVLVLVLDPLATGFTNFTFRLRER